MHFTYAQPDSTALFQGDVLTRTTELTQLIANYHRYFAEKEDYKYFAVLTQSCDLVRRNDECTARYVILAAVRPVEVSLRRLVDSLRQSEVERKLQMVDGKTMNKLAEATERLLNNNHDDYFFYSAEPSLGINGDYCAFLHLSIPVLAREHYELLLAAKIAQLSPEFQAKLGNCLGRSFSRVGTQDWPRKELTRKRDDVLTGVNLVRVSDKAGAHIRKKLSDGSEEEISKEALTSLIEEAEEEPRRRLESVLEAIDLQMSKVGVEEDARQTVIKRLRNEPVLRSLISGS